jgi:hypothetical protein
MKINFTYHAQYRLNTQKYSTEEIKRTMRQPDFEERLFDGTIVSDKRFYHKILRVVYMQKQNMYVILSFYYLD